jgi:NAD(P)-dependent dehydrogenase (short-subunit alcohol dehydrogenase family)
MNVFREKVVIITGGASGIGEALGCELGKRGAKVVLADRNAELLEKVVESQKARGRHVKGEQLDVTDFEKIKKAFDTTAGREGRLDYVLTSLESQFWEKPGMFPLESGAKSLT